MEAPRIPDFGGEDGFGLRHTKSESGKRCAGWVWGSREPRAGRGSVRVCVFAKALSDTPKCAPSQAAPTQTAAQPTHVHPVTLMPTHGSVRTREGRSVSTVKPREEAAAGNTKVPAPNEGGREVASKWLYDRSDSPVHVPTTLQACPVLISIVEVRTRRLREVK